MGTLTSTHRKCCLADEQDFNTDVVVITFFPDEMVSKIPSSVRQLAAPIEIIDDNIDEATQQLFVVVLNVSESVNPSLVDNSVRNLSLCRIGDDDRKLEWMGVILKVNRNGTFKLKRNKTKVILP